MVIAAALPLLGGCVDRGNAAVATQKASAVEAEQPSRETYAIGTALTPQGAIPAQATGDSFLRGGEVFLSVDVAGATTEHQIEVRWMDAEGRVLRRDARRVGKGTDYVPFSSGPTSQWQNGAYRAVIVIDGRAVNEKAFQLL
jgi:hypothetical protein